MNENAQKWVAALESGDYKQGTLRLRSKDDEFCCLGVACDLAEKEGIVESRFNEGVQAYSYRGPGDDAGAEPSIGYLPDSVRTWLGLTSSMGSHSRGKYGRESLTSLNDGKGFTFLQIADRIKSDPEGLFE